MKTKGERSGNFPSQNQTVWNVDYIQKLWTMEWNSSVRVDHKILNNEAHNKNEYNNCNVVHLSLDSERSLWERFIQ